MSDKALPSAQIVHLSPGAQAIINGALVHARGACTLEVGSGACVITGRATGSEGAQLRNPEDELYLSLLDGRWDRGRLALQRERLFALLGEVIAQDRSHMTQAECAQCAAALVSGDPEAALESAARMVSSRMESRKLRSRAGHADGVQAAQRKAKRTV